MPLTPIVRARATGLALGWTLAVALSGCGSTSADPAALLADAKRTLDGTGAVHFQLSSSDRPAAAGTQLIGGEGDLNRPAAFSGQLDVLIEGFAAKVGVVSVDHGFWVRLPFASRYTMTDPSKYGVADPAELLDPERGLTSALVQVRSPSRGDPDRFRGEQLEEVHGSLPGDLVARLVTSADPNSPKRDVPAVFGIATDSHQLRRVTLTGLLLDPHHTSTYTLILDRYGEDVTITRPG